MPNSNKKLTIQNQTLSCRNIHQVISSNRYNARKDCFAINSLNVYSVDAPKKRGSINLTTKHKRKISYFEGDKCLEDITKS